MKIILENGLLSIEKLGKVERQYCPYTTTPESGMERCGTWCPFFAIEEELINNKKILFLELKCGAGIFKVNMWCRHIQHRKL